MLVSIGKFVSRSFIVSKLPRSILSVKLQKMESVHNQLSKVNSIDSIAFLRKYNYNGPVPESLTNYLDVTIERRRISSRLKTKALRVFRLNITVTLVSVHQLSHSVSFSSNDTIQMLLPLS